MAESSVHEAICNYLSKLQIDEQVEVLYAVESGSRAWGFASPDSDFDIRFIYLRPQDWYLSVQHRRDVLEAMVDPELDFAGWDLPKALVLLRKSNPSLVEWLYSPIVYTENSEFMVEFRELAGRCLSLNACLKHYLNMAHSNWQTYFDSDTVSLKKYLYVLRPVFACRWIERYSTVPPVEFDHLLAGAGQDGAVAREIFELLRAKSESSEVGKAPHLPVLDAFIESELKRIRELKHPTTPPVDYQDLDVFFRKWVSWR